MLSTNLRSLVLVVAMVALIGAGPCVAQAKPPLSESQAIAEEAYLYGFPMIVGYKVMYEYNIDRNSGQFKAPFNQISNEARVFTYKDTTISTPNSDTPYSVAQLDLRAEPMVLCMPEIDKSRYYDVQLVDMYTDNYGYIGSRATGNGAGCYMVDGPNWKGEIARGIAKEFRSETQFSLVVYRTQLFDPADMDNVKKSRPATRSSHCRRFLASQHRPLRRQSTGRSLSRPHSRRTSRSISIFCCSSARQPGPPRSKFPCVRNSRR